MQISVLSPAETGEVFLIASGFFVRLSLSGHVICQSPSASDDTDQTRVIRQPLVE